jgi:hypothetical protein
MGYPYRKYPNRDLRSPKTIRREAREEAAKEIECNCPGRDKIASLPPNSGERWRLCPEYNCRAIWAAAIRALNEKEGKP